MNEDDCNNYPKYCGIESNNIVLVDFERKEVKAL